MRLSFFLVLFALSVLNYETVNCGLVKGFFEKVHETAHNAREHIEDTLHLRNKETEDGSKTEKVETSTPKKWEGEQPTEQKIETTTKAEVKPAEASKKENFPEIQSTEEPKKESKTDRVETVEPKKDDSENPKEQKVETKPTEEPKKDNKPEIVTETITSTTPASIAPAANDNSKDGRENFKGACIAGYQRTPDGRCKPTF